MEAHKNIINLDLQNLPQEYAAALHQFLQCDEEKIASYKIGFFEQDRIYTIDNKNVVFNYSMVYIRKANDQFFYSIFCNKSNNGKGGYATFYQSLGRLKHDQDKMIFKGRQNGKYRGIKVQDKGLENCETECEIAQRVSYIKANQLTTVYDNGEKKACFIEMCLLPGVKLTNTLIQNSYSIKQLIQLSINLLSQLEYLQSLNVIHRDIKPDNIHVDENDNMAAYIFDFNVSRFKTDANREFRETTLIWMSPEMINNPAMANEKCDIYSMGLILRILWCDIIAYNDIFETECIHAIYKRGRQYLDYQETNLDGNEIIFSDDILSQIMAEFPSLNLKDLKDTLLKLTSLNPENRLSLEEGIRKFREMDGLLTNTLNPPTVSHQK